MPPKSNLLKPNKTQLLKILFPPELSYNSINY